VNSAQKTLNVALDHTNIFIYSCPLKHKNNLPRTLLRNAIFRRSQSDGRTMVWTRKRNVWSVDTVEEVAWSYDEHVYYIQALLWITDYVNSPSHSALVWHCKVRHNGQQCSSYYLPRSWGRWIFQDEIYAIAQYL